MLWPPLAPASTVPRRVGALVQAHGPPTAWLVRQESAAPSLDDALLDDDVALAGVACAGVVGVRVVVEAVVAAWVAVVVAAACVVEAVVAAACVVEADAAGAIAA